MTPQSGGTDGSENWERLLWIYDSTLMEAGNDQLLKAMVNKGFLSAKVVSDTVR